MHLYSKKISSTFLASLLILNSASTLSYGLESSRIENSSETTNITSQIEDSSNETADIMSLLSNTNYSNLEDYHQALMSGEIAIEDSIYYNNYDYYTSNDGDTKTVGSLIALGTRLLSSPWAQNVIRTFMVAAKSGFGVTVLGGFTVNRIEDVMVNGFPKVKTSSIIGYNKITSGFPVLTLQKYLNQYGYGLEEDGKFGPTTNKAVRSFQSSRGLTVDGLVGPATWLKIVTHKSAIS